MAFAKWRHSHLSTFRGGFLAALMLTAFALSAIAQSAPHANQTNNPTHMTIEIWSDVACPFCYIGMKNLQAALSTFPEREQVEVVWRSFLLDPTLPEHSDHSLYQSLSERKGVSIDQARAMAAHAESMGKTAGIDFHFDRVVPVNTGKAHRLLQYAKSRGAGPAMKKRLFSAYFCEGVHVANQEDLIRLATEVGLPAQEARQALTDPQYADAVQRDVTAAAKLGIRGVPHFVIGGSTALSGAQPPAALQQAIARAYAAWKASLPATGTVANGALCTPQKVCVEHPAAETNTPKTP